MDTLSGTMYHWDFTNIFGAFFIRVRRQRIVTEIDEENQISVDGEREKSSGKNKTQINVLKR